MPSIALHDFEPRLDSFHTEVVSGLTQPAKTLPCKFLYDERGSRLFDQICGLPEYYPTRTEMAIMRDAAEEMAALLGPGCRLIEYGSGSSLKTRILLDHAPNLASYVPVDISREHLLKSAQDLAAMYPHLEILPVCADYTQAFTLPAGAHPVRHSVVYFPGSTVGNFHPRQAQDFLTRIAHLCGAGGGLLIGVDLKKSPSILEPAYNDAQGVTAAFNLNLLTRINRELGGDFQLSQWRHDALYNPLEGRIEMHLVSRQAQRVRVGDVTVHFEAGETIHTECSYKYSLDDFDCLAQRAGWTVRRVWTDPQQLFSVQYLVVQSLTEG